MGARHISELLLCSAVLWIAGCSPGNRVTEKSLQGKWLHSSGLGTLEFKADLTYTITENDGKVGKRGGWRMIGDNTLEWEHFERAAPGGAPFNPGKDNTVIVGTIHMVKLHAEIKGDELTLRAETCGMSKWRRLKPQ